MSDLLVRLYDLPHVRTEEKIASHDAIDIPGSEESIYGPMLHDDKGRAFDDL